MQFLLSSPTFRALLSYFTGPKGIFNFTGQIYPTDLLDIFIITLFIYSILYLFKRTRTFLILFGLIIISLLYVLARIFNLYLTSSALQYFFGVSVVVFIIIFQSEIRKYFELLGLLGTRRIKVGRLTTKSPSTGEILQSTVKMAQSRIGALIVVQGHDALDHLLEGGILLDGIISEEVLLSIFDPHSLGHDGALVISNGRITKFGAHLPLSNNFNQLGKRGTRHSAALGLSENCDALCIVVSEEKGRISICRDGKLKTLTEFSDLEKEMEKFIKAKFVSTPSWNLKYLVSKNLTLKTLALFSAAIIWFFSAYRTEIISKTYSIPINFTQLPQDVLIETYSPKEIAVTVVGRGDLAFTGIDTGDFKIDLDTSILTDGVNKFDISPQLIKQPLNLSIISIDPNVILLTAKKYYSASVGIDIKTKGELPSGYTITTLSVTPNQVDLWIPDGFATPKSVVTELVDLSGQTESFVIPAKLVIPAGIKLQKPESVDVNIAVSVSH